MAPTPPSSRFAHYPSAGLVATTPLVALRGISQWLGCEVLCKRDDIGDISLAGAKARKLDLLLPALIARGVKDVVACGPATSNSCRALAAACVRTGLQAHLVLAGAPGTISLNATLSAELGAQIHWVDGLSWPELEHYAARLANQIGAYAMAPGATEPLGVLAMMLAGQEMLAQASAMGIAPKTIVHASATGGVCAGLRLAVGRANIEVISVAVVGDLYPDMEQSYERFTQAARHTFGLREPAPLCLDRSQLGEGYVTPPETARAAVHEFAHRDGLILDARYTGRAAAVVLERCAPTAGPIVFWHTGGVWGAQDR